MALDSAEAEGDARSNGEQSCHRLVEMEEGEITQQTMAHWGGVTYSMSIAAVA